MDAPKVAVIICTYNMAKFLPESVDSALLLRYPNFEIIVVDDGSTDGTKELVEQRYAGKVTYIYQENGGLFSARKTGIAHAGDAVYYSIVDADDMVHPLKVRDEVTFLERNPDVAVCFSNLFLFDNEGKAIGAYWNGSDLIEGDKLYGKIENPIKKIARCRAFTSVSTIRASAYQRVGGYDSTLKCSGDMDLAIRLTRVGGSGFINKLRYFYRHDGHGMTLYMRNRIAVYMKIFDKIRANASDFTHEEIMVLSAMEKEFLLQALWGTYLGSTDKSLRGIINQRLLKAHHVLLQPSWYVLQFLGLFRLAHFVSGIREAKRSQKKMDNSKLHLSEILEDEVSCFDDFQ